MQWDRGELLPATIGWSEQITASADGTLQVVVALDGMTQLARRAPGGDWTYTPIHDSRSFEPPPGYPRGGTPAGEPVAGPGGYVSFAPAIFRESGPISSAGATYLGIIHTSSDGVSWSRVDLRETLGAATSVAHGQLIATSSSYILAVSVSNRANTDPQKIAVLVSGDGHEWRQVTVLSGERWSVIPVALHQLGGRLLLVGWELACDTDGTFLGPEPAARILRLWTSDDDGAGWAPLAPDPAIFSAPEANPTAATCDAVANPYTDLPPRFGTKGHIVGVANDTLVAITGPGGSQAATTRDLASWTVADLPGAVPVGIDPATFEIRTADTVHADAGTIMLFSSQQTRGLDNGFTTVGGSQVLGWHTTDGQVWTAYPMPRPTLTDPTRPIVAGDGNAYFIEWLGRAADEDLGYVLYTSTAGPFEPWGRCTPAPDADCRFTQLQDFDGRGLQAPNMDFTGGRIERSDFSGANLSGGLFPDVYVDAALIDADLRNVQAERAFFVGDLTGAVFDGANLTEAFMDGSLSAASYSGVTWQGLVFFLDPGDSLENADFSGLDLAAVSFHARQDRASMRNADFSGANLEGVSFVNVDLTGADFSGASVDDVHFADDTICPNGEPPRKVDFRNTCGDLTP
jgi:uncharacterized protein YjbI with pentapeptide repeats